VDVLLHEALDTALVGTMQKAAQRRGAKPIAKVLANIPGYHTSPVDAARIAALSDARMLVYYHTIPPLPFTMVESLFLEGTDKAFDGDIRIGKDGDLISLPAGSKQVDYTNTL
jgi:ribonuclease Z